MFSSNLSLGLLTTFIFSYSASAAIINLSNVTGVDFTGGRAANGELILVGGQNNTSPAEADISSQLGFSTDGSITQTYAVMLTIGISEAGINTARGFQFSEGGDFQNSTGPNFRFIENHSGNNFAFSIGPGQRIGDDTNRILTSDINGNSWAFENDAPQTGEFFSINFQVDFYQPEGVDQNTRQFDYFFEVTRSDPNNLVANDTLTFRASKQNSGTNFVNSLGDLQFRGSGNGNNGENVLLATLSDVVVANQVIPVPEPSTSLIIALAGVSLGFRRRRK